MLKWTALPSWTLILRIAEGPFLLFLSLVFKLFFLSFSSFLFLMGMCVFLTSAFVCNLISCLPPPPPPGPYGFFMTEAQCKPYYSDYSPTRRLIHKMCTSHYLDLFITIVIGLNVITMSMEHYQQPKVGPWSQDDLEKCHLIN